MRYALAVLLALAASPVAAQTSLQLRWELKDDVFRGSNDPGASRVAFTLTNRDAKPLPARGWAIYFSALHEPLAGTVRGGAAIENVTGDLQRMVPGADFPRLAPGQSVELEYLTSLLTNGSFAPVGPYLVFDDDPGKGHPLTYVAAPFERPPQLGRDPRVVTPQAQFELDAATRDIPAMAVTASAMTQDRQKIMAAGFDAYQTKPINVREFVEAVRAILTDRQASPPGS